MWCMTMVAGNAGDAHGQRFRCFHEPTLRQERLRIRMLLPFDLPPHATQRTVAPSYDDLIPHDQQPPRSLSGSAICHSLLPSAVLQTSQVLKACEV